MEERGYVTGRGPHVCPSVAQSRAQGKIGVHQFVSVVQGCPGSFTHEKDAEDGPHSIVYQVPPVKGGPDQNPAEERLPDRLESRWTPKL